MLDRSEFDETAYFCSMFDRFFDCLNTRDAKEGKKKRKPDLDPYRSIEDGRFQVCDLFVCFFFACMHDKFVNYVVARARLSWILG